MHSQDRAHRVHFQQALDEYIAAEMEHKHVPGLSLAVIKAGTRVLEKSFGVANVELRVPATRDTVYEIASITKMFTASAVMLLVEDGLIGLHDPLTHFRDGLPDAWQAVTVKHLLSHTSGISNWSVDWSRRDLAPEEIWQDVFGSPFQFPPGTHFEYVDKNYNVLGMIIWCVSGKPYDAFLQERIFQPLGMTATCHNDWRAIVRNRAAGYEWEDQQLLNAPRMEWNHINLRDDVPANGANGSLLSTLADLCTWERALATGSILKQSLLDQMWAPVPLTSGGTAPYGLGWELEVHQGHRLITHGGGIPGFTTTISRFLDRQLTVIILTNQDSDPWDMAKVVAELYDPTLRP